ncbi:hypothetical protein RUND412_002773 [Rhizina undulata]
MLTTVHPPIPEEDLIREEKASARRELEWLLHSLKETISTLRSGLEECLALTQPFEPGSTLALSTPRSEALKGYITRIGNRIVKGDMYVKTYGLPYNRGHQAYKISFSSGAHGAGGCLVLDQMTDVQRFIEHCLEILGMTQGQELVDATDAQMVMEKMTLLQANIRAGIAALRSTPPHTMFPYRSVDPNVFDPTLPPNVTLDLYISEAALVVELRTLEPVEESGKSGFSLIGGIAAAVGWSGTRGEHDEVVTFNAREVRVRERITVESQDPSLMALWAKLGGLEHALGLAIESLRKVSVAAGIIRL